MPGQRDAGPPRKSNGSGLGVAFACAVGHSAKLLQSCNDLKPLKRLAFAKLCRFEAFAAFKAWLVTV